MKITKSQLKEIIKEEVSRLKKQYILEDKKKAITEELRMLNENIGEEEMEFLRTVKSTTPELYNKYLNKVKRKGLDVAINDFYPHTEEGKREARQQEVQAKRDAKKSDRLKNELEMIDEILSTVSRKEMAEYMNNWRNSMLDGEQRAPNKRYDADKQIELSLLARAYIYSRGLNDSLMSKRPRVFDDADELSAFDEYNYYLRRGSERVYKIFKNEFKNKFGSLACFL